MINYLEVENNGYILRGLENKPIDPKALVIMFHGFTGHLNENGYFFKVLSEELSANGFWSMRFDFMGSGISDGHFSDMTFDTELGDARAIINYAISKKQSLPLYVLGFSCGGAIAGIMSREYPEIIDKLILCSPAGNMDRIARSYRINPNANWYDDENIDMGGYLMSKKFMDGFLHIDFYKDIENFKHPVLITHGEMDKSVPIEYGRRYQEKYQNVEFHEIKGSEHCYTRMPYRLEVNKLIIDFCKK